MVKGKKFGPAKLPVAQLTILAICRFAEPVALTSVFPYLPEMIESFGVEEKDVAKWAGITSAVFSLAQCITAIFWGRASDTFGRKPTILAGLTCTMILNIVWGMSVSLPMAIIARALQGAFNGNVGIIRTMVAEMVPQKELQPRAFSIMPLVWSLGSIFGPSFGGFFARPAQNFPNLFGNNRYFLNFPFALPNIIASFLFMIGITTGILFLRETLESKRNKRDWGLEMGKKVISSSKVLCCQPRPKHHSPGHPAYDESSASLLRPTSASESDSTETFDDNFESPKSKSLAPPSLREVFTRQSVINLVAYTFLALHSVSYDQILSVFMHHPRQIHDSTNTQLPFKFSGGFGLHSGRIGTIFTLYGVVGGFIQFVIFPPAARKFGVLNCFKVCAITFPIICFVTPYTALIESSIWQQIMIFAILIVKSFAVIFAFPCCIILLTNSAISLRILGTLNGFAVSISAVGRAIGPAMSGAAFTWGLKEGYVVTPYFLLGTIAAIGAIPIWYLEEMEGFNKSGTSDDEAEEESLLQANDEETGLLASDERIRRDPNEEAPGVVEGAPLSKSISISASKRRESRLEENMSSPIGMIGGSVGPGGGRRLSNGLAVSNFGQGTGGTSFT
ncbi:92c81509-f3a4-43ed-a67a-812f04ac4713 [Sclerotinia trifoliorum]|uniref:92c81509-f3a4-43ed-a67a-812f04ac4713 n=1 Tax=Sclerotinia trifoliorum TaxID=28548 RepID=A0A8H2VQC0_9HELO|nr:92c81509-f3a4-43ed-a67a-812f04ac4713 [Sclerotinia trifoliorum]